MKALRLHRVGSFDGIRWEEVADPAIGEFDVLVKIHAVSLNYRDYGFIKGTYSLVRDLPFILGSDSAGVVVKVGPKVSQFKIGDRVISLLRQYWYGGKLDVRKAASQLGGSVDGVFSELAAFHEGSVVHAPSHLSFEEAATLSTAGLTAFRILTQSGVTSGQRVLIQGTGSVSLFAIQLAGKMGFQIFATTGQPNNEIILKELGAHGVINYKAFPQWQKEINRLTGNKGVDLVIDIAGGTSIQQSLEAVAMNGEVAVVGFLNGTQSTIDLVTMIRKNVRLSGYTTGSRDDLQQFVQWLEVNPIRPIIAYVYTDFMPAFQTFEKREKPGKLVVKFD